jgi:hypothetical protein
MALFLLTGPALTEPKDPDLSARLFRDEYFERLSVSGGVILFLIYLLIIICLLIYNQVCSKILPCFP